MQTPSEFQPAPKRSNGCLIAGIIAAILAACACGGLAVAMLGGFAFFSGFAGGQPGGVAALPTAPSYVDDTPTPRASASRPPATAAAAATVNSASTARPGATAVSAATPQPAATAARVNTPAPGDSVFPTISPGARDTSLQQQTFDQAWSTINENYVDPKFNGLDWKAEQTRMNQRIKAGMSNAQFWVVMADLVDRLGDGHSYFLTPQEALEDAAKYVGEDGYIGIGVSTNFRPDKSWLYVLRVTPGGPAERAGIRPHDLLLKIDGKPAISADGVPQTSLLRGDEGTTVRLTVRMPGKPEREVTVARAVIRSNVVLDYRLLPGARKIGYLRIPAFDEKTIRDKAADAVEQMMEQSNGKMDGLILDLRQNGGGNYPQLASVLGLFTKTSPGDFVNRKGERDPLEVIDLQYGNAFTVKLMILIGRDTESFGEIFAGSMQSARAARLVGQPSAGNIELLRAYSLYDGSKMSIALETFRLPNGGNWEGTGLTPDIPVATAWDEFGADDPDPVLQAAIDALAR